MFPKLNFGNSSFQNWITPPPSFVKNFLFPLAFRSSFLVTNCNTLIRKLQNGTVASLLKATSAIVQVTSHFLEDGPIQL
jgi:hypothetical protein